MLSFVSEILIFACLRRDTAYYCTLQLPIVWILLKLNNDFSSNVGFCKIDLTYTYIP